MRIITLLEARQSGGINRRLWYARYWLLTSRHQMVMTGKIMGLKWSPNKFLHIINQIIPYNSYVFIRFSELKPLELHWLVCIVTYLSRAATCPDLLLFLELESVCVCVELQSDNLNIPSGVGDISKQFLSSSGTLDVYVFHLNYICEWLIWFPIRRWWSFPSARLDGWWRSRNIIALILHLSTSMEVTRRLYTPVDFTRWERAPGFNSVENFNENSFYHFPKPP